MNAVIFDTETTGGEPPMMIEAGGIELTPGDAIDLRAWSTFEQRYNPGVPSTLGALATHHILDSELEGMPHPNSFSLGDATYLIGHNIDYDWRVIGQPEVKRICTLALARWIWPTNDSHTLGACAYHVVGNAAREMLKNAHSALADCETTRWLLRYLIYLARRCAGRPIETWEDLWQLSEHARVPTSLPFGEHKGKPLAEVPADYLGWLLRARENGPDADKDPYLLTALRHALGR